MTALTVLDVETRLLPLAAAEVGKKFGDRHEAELRIDGDWYSIRLLVCGPDGQAADCGIIATRADLEDETPADEIATRIVRAIQALPDGKAPA